MAITTGEIFSLPLVLLYGAYLTYILGHTADVYYSPTLQGISDCLDLSYDAAGVTLLALGNGAPYVFSSVAAFTSSSSR